MRPPILDFDPTRDAIIDPIAPDVKVPERGVLTWFTDVLEGLEDAEVVHTIRLESAVHRIIVVDRDGTEFLVAEMGVGAPISAAVLETVIAMGDRSVPTTSFSRREVKNDRCRQSCWIM